MRSPSRYVVCSIDDENIYVSVLVLGEIRKGIERARATNPSQARALDKWLSTLSQSFADRILPIDLAVADEWGRMSAKRPVSRSTPFWRRQQKCIR